MRLWGVPWAHAAPLLFQPVSVDKTYRKGDQHSQSEVPTMPYSTLLLLQCQCGEASFIATQVHTQHSDRSLGSHIVGGYTLQTQSPNPAFHSYFREKGRNFPEDFFCLTDKCYRICLRAVFTVNAKFNLYINLEIDFPEKPRIIWHKMMQEECD